MNIIQRIKQIASHCHSLIKPDNDKVIFDFGYWEITKREIITSLIIIAVMLIIGFTISEHIAAAAEDKKRMYNQALQVEDPVMFKYGMETGVGNAFVYGTLAAVDTVTFDEVGGVWLWIEKTREEYTEHTREVAHTDSKGNTYYTTEVYYSWDYAGSEEKHSKKITFLGVEFDYNKIRGAKEEYIDTIYEWSDVRYVYYGSQLEHTGTIFTKLSDGTISDNNSFYENQTITEVLESKNNDLNQVVFWIFWTSLIIGAVVGFYYLDNSWLD